MEYNKDDNQDIHILDKFIGEKPEDLIHAGGVKFNDMEGCICKRVKV